MGHQKQEWTPYSQFLPNFFLLNAAATTPELIKFRRTEKNCDRRDCDDVTTLKPSMRPQSL